MFQNFFWIFFLIFLSRKLSRKLLCQIECGQIACLGYVEIRNEMTVHMKMINGRKEEVQESRGRGNIQWSCVNKTELLNRKLGRNWVFQGMIHFLRWRKQKYRLDLGEYLRHNDQTSWEIISLVFCIRFTFQNRCNYKTACFSCLNMWVLFCRDRNMFIWGEWTSQLDWKTCFNHLSLLELSTNSLVPFLVWSSPEVWSTEMSWYKLLSPHFGNYQVVSLEWEENLQDDALFRFLILLIYRSLSQLE